MNENNAMGIGRAVAFLEADLMEERRLSQAADACGYSKYHFERIFAAMVGCTVYQYVKRRRLTEAARRLAQTDEAVVDIALACGYDSQQAFTKAFRGLYGQTPRAYRTKGVFHPLQLPFVPPNAEGAQACGAILHIRRIECPPRHIAGFSARTDRGFYVIGGCWRRLHRVKDRIANRTDAGYTVAVDDYRSNRTMAEDQPGFDYCAGVEVSAFGELPRGAAWVELPACTCLAFTFRGRAQDSVQPLFESIYRGWFAQSSARLDDSARFDVVRYAEVRDARGLSEIEVLVPVLGE